MNPSCWGASELLPDCHAAFSRIQNVDTTTFTAQDRNSEGVPFANAPTIQVPEVAKLVVEGAIEMRFDQTVLIDGIREYRANGEPDQSLILMITPRLLRPST